MENAKCATWEPIRSGAAVVNVNHNWASSHRSKVNEDSGELLIFTRRSTLEKRCVQINGILRGEI